MFTGTFSNGTATAGLCEDPAGVQHHGAYPSVPKGLDWISIDYYPDGEAKNPHHPLSGWVFVASALISGWEYTEGTIAGARKIYEELIYPKMVRWSFTTWFSGHSLFTVQESARQSHRRIPCTVGRAIGSLCATSLWGVKLCQHY